jgi:hypothetical protein
MSRSIGSSVERRDPHALGSPPMETRPRPEDFLEIVERAKRGRLKVYIGPAAGVGKTYRMLEEAHALHRRGVDVVLGFVETHGRADTAALLEAQAMPRRRVSRLDGRGDGPRRRARPASASGGGR